MVNFKQNSLFNLWEEIILILVSTIAEYCISVNSFELVHMQKKNKECINIFYCILSFIFLLLYLTCALSLSTNNFNVFQFLYFSLSTFLFISKLPGSLSFSLSLFPFFIYLFFSFHLVSFKFFSCFTFYFFTFRIFPLLPCFSQFLLT